MSGRHRPSRRVLGIVGGMGAAASAAFYQRLVALTPAADDGGHLEVVLYADPAVPDRTRAILGLGPDPGPRLERAVQRLAEAGAGTVAIACITAHHWLPRLRRAAPVEILDAVAETVALLRHEHRGAHRIGLLATSGTLHAGLFQAALADAGLVCLTPEPGRQERLVMGAVYGPDGLKAGRRQPGRRRLLRAVRWLREEGADLIVLACTELPLVLGERALGLPLLDPMDALARAAIRDCLGLGRRFSS